MQVIGGVKNHAKTRWAEWALALTLLGQSGLLIAGGNLHANSLYVVMRGLVNVRYAAAVGAGIATLWLTALVLNGTFLTFRRISPWVRVLIAALCSCYWSVWAFAVYQAARDYTSIAWFNYAAFAAMAAMCVFMAAGEVARADKKAAQWHRSHRKIGVS